MTLNRSEKRARSELLNHPEAYFESVGLKRLRREQIIDISNLSHIRIEENIKKGKAFPTFLKPQNEALLQNCEDQETIVIEVGGTNMRASFWKLNKGKLIPPEKSEQMKGALPLAGEPGKEKPKTRFQNSDEFFTELFKTLKGLDDLIKAHPEAVLSIVFSFPGIPGESQQGLDYKVSENLTKDFDIPGLQGENFISKLNEFLKRKKNIEPKKMALFNDTANLLENNLGLVIGTGFNFAIKMSVLKLRKILGQDFALDWKDEEEMIINTEAGSLGIAHEFFDFKNPNSIIARIDQKSDKHGEGMDEKLISGMYLEQSLDLILDDLSFISGGRTAKLENSVIKTEDISSVLAGDWGKIKSFKVHENDRSFVRKACERIRDISVDVAVGLVNGGLSLADERSLKATIEGSVYWKIPGYKERFEKKFHKINGSNFEVDILSAAKEGVDPNLGSQRAGAVCGIQYWKDRNKRR
jgi:hexokinase